MNKEAYRKRIFEAPRPIQDLLSAETTTTTIGELNKKYAIKNPGALALEVGLMLVGETHPKDFKSQLANKLELSEEKALDLARDINRELLASVKELLMEMHGITPPVGTKGSPEKLTSPKPSVVSPFEKKAASRAAAPVGKVLPTAPTPPAEYLEKHGLATPTPTKKQSSPENSFEAKLVEKLKEKGKAPESLKASTDTVVPEAIPVADKTPAKDTKLHTTVAQAPKEVTPVHERTQEDESSAVDPYREPLD